MRDVLLVWDQSPASPRPDRLARLAGMLDLYLGLGCQVDLLCLSPFRLPGHHAVSLPDGVRNLGVVPAPAAPGGSGPQADAVRAAISGLQPQNRYGIVHLDGARLPRATVPEAFWVADAFDGNQITKKNPDLVLAALEKVRSEHSAAVVEAVRIPASCCPDTSSGPPGAMVGWPGALSHPAQRSFRDILQVLNDRAVKIEGGIVLPSSVRVPPALARYRAVAKESDRKAAFRALGLGVLPCLDAAEHLHDLVRAIAKGRPVLTTSVLAAQFEGRWHLPTADTAEELAGWIEGWIDGRDVPYFSEAAEETRRAFAEDSEAMWAHAGGVLKTALSAATEPEAQSS